MITIISAVYDRYEVIKPTVPQTVPCDWVMVTDDPSVPDGYLGWRTVFEPRPGVHPNGAAKRPKFEPWRYTDAPASLWVDASHRITSPSFAEEVMPLASVSGIAQFLHPWRDDIYTEALASTAPKYTGQPITEQAAHYRAAGHPEGWGLWASCVIARVHTDRVRVFGERWTEEVERWSFQDQVSEPVVLRETGLRPEAIPGDPVHNPKWFLYEGSARH